MVRIGRGPAQLGDGLENLVRELAIDLVPFDQHQAPSAVTHSSASARAGIPQDFGDCISYALARSRGLPLLFKGEDFVKTGIMAAL
jgi:ribonuclease VapC